MKNKKLTELQKNILDCVSQAMSTKEIMSKLNCSESIVKKVRASKELNKVYEESKSKTDYDAIKEIIPQMIETMKQIINNPSSSNDTKIAASKQLIELCKVKETVFPEKVEHIVRIEYV